MAESETPKSLLEALDLIRASKGPKPESLDALEMTHVKRVRSIFEDKNIVAIGIANKTTEKKSTGELGLCFYVEKKLSKAKVAHGKLIPPVISVADRVAVFTDVQEIGKVRPQINKRKAPLLSGFSVGNQTETGTLGAIVKKGKKFFLLSNSHVLADSGTGKVGDKIIYPGSADTSGQFTNGRETFAHPAVSQGRRFPESGRRGARRTGRGLRREGRFFGSRRKVPPRHDGSGARHEDRHARPHLGRFRR